MKYHFKAVGMLFAVSVFWKIYLNFEKNMQVPIQDQAKSEFDWIETLKLVNSLTIDIFPAIDLIIFTAFTSIVKCVYP